MTVTIIKGITAVVITPGNLYSEITVTGSYNAASSDNYIYINNNTGTPISMVLPSSPSANQYIVYKDVAGNAATNNITITGTVDGTVNPIIGANYGGAGLLWTGSLWTEIF